MTLTTVKYRLPELLRALGDNTDPAQAVVFFRPSFGRSRPPLFGEFDLLIGTCLAVYLGESKWPGSAGYVPGGELILPPEQRRRHAIFKAWRGAYRARVADNYAALAAAAMPRLAPFGSFSFPPPADSLLAKTLLNVLSALDGCGDDMRDFLLFVQTEGGTWAPPARCDGFTIVSMMCRSVIGDFVRTVGSVRWRARSGFLRNSGRSWAARWRFFTGHRDLRDRAIAAVLGAAARRVSIDEHPVDQRREPKYCHAVEENVLTRKGAARRQSPEAAARRHLQRTSALDDRIDGAQKSRER
jgi:hypothetical protein